MTTETEGKSTTRFGQISRSRGVLFKYLLLIATLSGLVSLGVLLANATIDAIRPFSAEATWYLTYLVTLIVPSVSVGWYLRSRNPQALRVGVWELFIPIGGLFAAGTLALLFDVIPFLVWFAWGAGITVLGVAYVAHRKIRPEASLRERTILGLVIGFVSLFGIPSVVPGIPGYVQFHVTPIPNRYSTILLTLALPAAAIVGRRVSQVEENRRAGLVAGGLVVVAALSVVFQYILAPGNALLLMLTVGVPTGYYAVMTIRHRPDVRIGLLFSAVIIGGALLGALVVSVVGIHSPESWLDWQLLTNFPTGEAETTGLYPALVGSVLLMFVIIGMTFPLGVGAAVYLEEYAPENRYTRFIQINIANLAGVPSVVYGLLALGLFINLGGLSGESFTIAGFTFQLMGLPTGSLIAGGLAISLLILPIVIISSQEAIRAVPDSLREASYGMGATRWQTVRNVVLPRAIPGILTGTILAIGRAVGETAPLIMVLVPTYVSSIPTGLFDKIGALPLRVYHWAFVPDATFRHGVVAAGVVVMLVVLLVINSIAIIIRNKYQREK
jgi:phosphate transport system permease protein